MILAYLDPGTGSLILQAILGGIAGIAVVFRSLRQRMFAAKLDGTPAPDGAPVDASTSE